ncbi:hypothetical protein QCA50_004360 [Cerrena zonata]|uniref:Uncharacterized protein n=1 Tax=Cerrena zonata TaxID=2478898 RepID=A0AAW0GS05_9APHY
MPKRKASSSKVKVEDVAPSKKKGFRPRTIVPSAAKTTVRRRNLDPPPTRSSGPSVLQLAKTRASLKRKHDSDHEDNNLFPDEPPALRTRSTTSLSRLSTLTSSSAPLTPRKSNIPSPIEKARRNGHASPPKKARRNSPIRKTTLSRQATAEIVPSSQSDEEELNLIKVPDVNPVEVMQSVDKWRRDSSVVATQGSSVMPPQDDVAPSEPDFMDTVLDTIPMDIDGELLYADPIPSSDPDILTSPEEDVIPSLPSSEDEVKNHLQAIDLSSPLESPKVITNRTPQRPNKASETSKVAIDEDVPMEDAFRVRTPSPVPDFLMSLTKTPVPRTQQTRTQQILADIHARAMQVSYDSDEDRPLELKDILDSNSSDDDDLDDDIFKKLDSGKKDKGKEKMLSIVTKDSTTRSSSPLTSLEPSRSASPTSANQRYNLRRHSPKEPNATAGPSTLTLPKPTRKKKLFNPLDALIKEKSTADRKGSGTDALRRAEEALASTLSSPVSTKRSLLDEMEAEEDSGDEDEDEVNWANEEAAMDIVRQGGRLRLKSSSPIELPSNSRRDRDVDDSDSDEDSDGDGGEGGSESLHEEEYRKILGEKEGLAVGNILKKDREMKVEKAKKKIKKAVKGVLLWERVKQADGDVEMDGDEEASLPALPRWKGKGKESPLMGALKKAVEDGNTRRLSTLLFADTFELLGADNTLPLLAWICDLAFSISSTSLGSQAFTILCQRPKLFASSNTPIPFDIIIRALSQLGAKRPALEQAGWSPIPNSSQSKPTKEQREELLLRLMKFISVYSRRHAFSDQAIPDLILALVLIGLDPSTTPDVLREIKSTIEHVCSNIVDERHEERVADRVTELCKGFEPINKAYVVSFFMRASPSSTRIVRWIARSLLLVPEKLSPCK